LLFKVNKKQSTSLHSKLFFDSFEEIFNTISDGSFLVDFLTMAMFTFFHYLIFFYSFGLFVCLFVCLFV